MYYLALFDKHPEDYCPGLQGPVALTIWYPTKAQAEECLRQVVFKADKYFGMSIAPGHPVWPETEIDAGRPMYEWSRIAFERLLRNPR